MAKENISRFIDTVMTDKALTTELAALASENGYPVTAEGLLELGMIQPLSNDDAEGASGRGPTTGLNPYGSRRTLPNK